MERRTVGSFVWILPIALLFSIGLLVWGLFVFADLKDATILAAGVVCVIMSLLAAFVVQGVWTAHQASVLRVDQLLGPVNERLQHLSVLLNLVSEQQLISERAKSIAFREKDREALRRAIREEMAAKNWEAALMLASDIETVFGFKQEADQFRGEIQRLREGDLRRDVAEATMAIDRSCAAEQWTLALREAERIAGLYPRDAQANQLPQEVEKRRQAHKKQLLDSWHDAVNRRDIDGSIGILRALDPYLTPQEASAMQDTARQVFKDKLLLMGHEFTVAVKEKQWADAVRVGEQIMNEFPNSRMAQEVRQTIDVLRKRAAEVSVA